MSEIFRHNMTIEEIQQYLKSSLGYDGYNHENQILERAVEIIEEQEKTIEELKNDKNRNHS